MDKIVWVAPVISGVFTVFTFGFLLLQRLSLNRAEKKLNRAYLKQPEEREFIEIFAEDIPDDIYTNPEYRGKPYYSIHYTQNGEDFVGFGTYSPKVLSRYLREYFFEQKGSEENEV